MYSKQVEIRNKTGLHARPAADFVSLSGKFKSKILVKKVGSDYEINGKSVIFILSLALSMGTLIEISAEGDDEVEAVEKLVELVESKFGE